MDGVAVVDCLKDVGGMGRALVVGDLAEVRENIGDRLSAVGFTIAYAEDGLDAYDVFVRDGSGLIVTDGQMPRLNGLGLVRRVREISNVPVVMLAEHGSIPDCEEAMRIGVDRYLQLRRDLDQIGRIACALVRDAGAKASSEDVRVCATLTPGAGGMTAARARSLARQELRKELQKQLVECRGNIAEMARQMGKDRSTIRYHLHRLGMLDSGPGESAPIASPDSDFCECGTRRERASV
jgi:DNA-binding NtrC family response regulator